MKLRLEENSLRLRLSEDEVRQFAATGRVAQALAFGSGPGQALSYALERLPEASPAPAVQVRYEAGALVIEVPAHVARNWTDTENIGFRSQILAADGQELRIVVERDLDRGH
jgi:hypothetical protein